MLSIAICWAVGVASASRLAVVTATIVLLVPHAGSVESMVVSRIAEITGCVCVAVGTVWVFARAAMWRQKGWGSNGGPPLPSKH